MTEVKHWPNGRIRCITVRNEDGKLHNPMGPAMQDWHKNGREAYRSYWLNGRAREVDGPTSQGWYKNGKKKFRSYWRATKPHNVDGPAIQGWDADGNERYRAYWVDGQNLTEAEFFEAGHGVGGK